MPVFNSAAFIGASSGTVNIAVGVGDVIIVGISSTGIGFFSVSNVTDNLGNNYNHLQQNTSFPLAIDMWTCTATHAGTAIISVTMSGTANFVISVADYSGVNLISVGYLNIPTGGTTIDPLNGLGALNIKFGPQAGTHTFVAIAANAGTAAISSLSGSLRASLNAANVNGCIGDISGLQGTTADPTLSIAFNETSITMMTEIYAPAPPPPPPPPPPPSPASGTIIPEDWLVGTMDTLKNNWSLTGDLAVGNMRFTTGPYQEQLQTPQISVTPLVEPYRPMNIGIRPTYYSQRKIRIDVWVKAKSDSNTSLGWAKNARWQLEQEIERIIRSNATVIPGIGFAKMEQFVERENLKTRPVLLNVNTRVNLIAFDNPVFPPVFHPAVFDPLIYDPIKFDTVPSSK